MELGMCEDAVHAEEARKKKSKSHLSLGLDLVLGRGLSLVLGLDLGLGLVLGLVLGLDLGLLDMRD